MISRRARRDGHEDPGEVNRYPGPLRGMEGSLSIALAQCSTSEHITGILASSEEPVCAILLNFEKLRRSRPVTPPACQTWMHQG